MESVGQAFPMPTILRSRLQVNNSNIKLPGILQERRDLNFVAVVAALDILADILEDNLVVDILVGTPAVDILVGTPAVDILVGTPVVDILVGIPEVDSPVKDILEDNLEEEEQQPEASVDHSNSS
eukprot:c16249_g1_i1 orf=290-664(-)